MFEASKRPIFAAILCGLIFWSGFLNASAEELQAVEKTIAHEGRERTYFVFAPEELKEGAALVMVLHGGGGDGRQMERYSQFTPLAAKEKFVVVYPQAVGRNWNDGRNAKAIKAQQEKIDDVGFLRAVVEEVSREHKIDRKHVFWTGISNGAIMSHRMAAEASDLVAAIAPVVGGMAPDVFENFKPKRPISILIIQGEKDPLVPLNGGRIAGRGRLDRGSVVSTEETLAKYLELNGSKGEPVESAIDGDPNDETSVVVKKYPDGAGGAKTHYYLIKNGGHAWPGRPPYAPQSLIGVASRDFDASEVIWEFFKSLRSSSEPR